MNLEAPTVLVVVADSSLGGTSRSAIQTARAWRTTGSPVVLLTAAPLAAGRGLDEGSGVRTVATLDDVPWDDVDIVHLHHWNWAQDERDRVQALLDAVSALPEPPRLLTNNIFSSPDPLLRAWPAPSAVAVLGTWSAHQYEIAMAGRPHPAPFVVGNPQDTSYFRPPTTDERREARAALGLGPEPVLLRAGSPLANKWSPSYAALGRAAGDAGMRLELVSPPDSVRDAVAGLPAVAVHDRIDDDALMRRWYWAADAFALDAERGESFGNVVMEALGTGLPVVYRGRPLRDNTPWEFRDLPGFTYAEGEDAWVRACVSAARAGRPAVDADAARDVIEQRYGVEAIGAELARAATALLAAPAQARLVGAPEGGRRADLSPRQRALVAVRHNPAAAVAKQLVNRLRAGGAGSPVQLLASLRGR